MKFNATNDFLAAQAKTAVTIMNATGWKQGTVNPECVLINSVSSMF